MAGLAMIRSGGKRAVAEALARLETDPSGTATAALLDDAYANPIGATVGLTGPPGVGKSTLLDALIKALRADRKTVAVLAVDPSSASSGGALLGDRTRLKTDPNDLGVFVRSMAARDQLGGVAGLTYPATVLMRALYDIVLVETVGVGQSETDISGIADMVMFCAQPGSGDALQYMKAGIVEVPDLIVVTKSDMGQTARRTVQDLQGALTLGTGTAPPSVLSCSAVTDDGIDAVVHEMRTILAQSSPRFDAARAMQRQNWQIDQIRARFGSEGLSAIQLKEEWSHHSFGFGAFLMVTNRFSTALTEAFR